MATFESLVTAALLLPIAAAAAWEPAAEEVHPLLDRQGEPAANQVVEWPC